MQNKLELKWVYLFCFFLTQFSSINLHAVIKVEDSNKSSHKVKPSSLHDLLQYANQYLAENNLDSAAFYLDKAMANYPKKQWPPILFELLLEIGKIYHDRSFYMSAIPYLETLVANEELHRSTYFQLTGLEILSNSRTLIGRFELAAQSFKEMKKLLHTLDAKKHDADSFINLHVRYYFGMGIHYAIQDQFQNALSMFMTADSLLKIGGSMIFKISCMLYIGNVHAELNQNEKALVYYKRVEKFIEQGYKVDLLQLYDNMAIAYNQLERYEEALFYLDKNLILAREKGDSLVVGYNFRTRAMIFESLGNNEEAYLQISKSIDAYSAAGDVLMVNNAKIYKTNLAILANKMDENIIDETKQTVMFFDTSGFQEKYFRALLALGNLYAAKMMFKEAAETYKSYAKLHTEWIKRNFGEQTAAMQTSFETDMYKREASLSEALKIQSAKLSKSLNYMTFSVALLLIIVLYLVFVYKKLVKSRRKVQEQNLKLAKNDTEKNLLIKELHHRVKNNLQIVSSLLSLQSKSAKDLSAQNAFKAGKHRVEAMAMIHKYLYTSNQLTDVDIKSYLTRLVESICFSYGYNKNQIDMVIDVEPKHLDVDVAIPLGLIANELVSNAFKHAFNEEVKPQLAVKLCTKNGLALTIADNGEGIGEFKFVKESGSFGMDLVHSLTQQLHAVLTYNFNSGAVFTLAIPENSILKRSKNA